MRKYHYLGEIHGEANALMGLNSAVRTTIMGCGECGAVVSGGPGQNQHDRWHAALTATIGIIPVIMPPADLPY